jgi:hypothetical protein
VGNSLSSFPLSIPFHPRKLFNSLFLSTPSVPILTMAAPAPAEPRVKPTKPDEEAYKASLAQAEKEHTAAQEKLVCLNLLLNWTFCLFGALN